MHDDEQRSAGIPESSSGEHQRLSRAEMQFLAYQLVHERSLVTPQDVRQLLGEYVAIVSAGESLPRELALCLRDLFSSYLRNEHRTLDQAFLLVRGHRGMPPVPADSPEELELAIQVLDVRLRNPGMSHQDALAKVANGEGDTQNEDAKRGITKVGKAWVRRRYDALTALRLTRAQEGSGFTWGDLKRAVKIVRKGKGSIRYR